MSRYSYCKRTWRSAVATVALSSAFVLATLCLADSVAAGERKVVGVTLLSLQSPYVIALDDVMKAEAVREGIDLVSLDSGRSVMTELNQVENLLTRKVDLIVMIPVDQKSSQTAAKLINKAGVPLVLLTTKFTDDFTSNGGKFVTHVGSDDTVAGEIEGQYLAKVLIGVNGLKPGLDAVAAGTLTATVFQNPVGQGRQAVLTASKILAGETVEAQLVIPFELVTKENVSSFKREVKDAVSIPRGTLCHATRISG